MNASVNYTNHPHNTNTNNNTKEKELQQQQQQHEQQQAAEDVKKLAHSNVLQDLEEAEEQALKLLDIVGQTCQELETSIQDATGTHKTTATDDAHTKKLRSLGGQYAKSVAEIGTKLHDAIDALDPTLAKRLCEYRQELEDRKRGLQQLYEESTKERAGSQPYEANAKRGPG